MSKTWGLIIVLVGGALIGWMAYLFNGVALDILPGMSDEGSVLRNEVRLTKLRQLKANMRAIETETIESLKDEVDQLLDHVAAGRVDIAAQQYREHLNEYSQDMSLSRTIADKWLRSGDYEAALILLYEQRLFIAFDSEYELLQLIYATVEKIEFILSEKKDIDGLISLYRLLISLHGDHPPYYLRLTHWLIESGDLYTAEQSLAGAVNDISYVTQVEVLKSRIEGTDISRDEGEISIPLRIVDGQFIVEVLLNERYPANLMIDTGASMSVLKTGLLEEFELDNSVNTRTVHMLTANGAVRGQQILVKSLKLGEIQLSNVDMGVLPLLQFDFDGLLGMNVLSRFEFFIDQENQQLLLK